MRRADYTVESLPPCDCPSGPCAHYPYDTPDRILLCRLGKSGLPRETEVLLLDHWARAKGPHDPQLPTMAQMAANYVQAQVKHWLAGQKRVPAGVKEARLAQCRACDKRIFPDPDGRDPEGRCSLPSCGCYLSDKAERAVERCTLTDAAGNPTPKWDQYKEEACDADLH